MVPAAFLINLSPEILNPKTLDSQPWSPALEQLGDRWPAAWV